MKKILMLIVAVVSFNTCFAKDVDTAFTEIEKATGTPVTTLTSDMLKAQLGDKANKIKDFDKSIKGAKVLTLEDLEAKKLEQVKQILKEVESDGYETFVNIDNEDGSVKVLAKKTDDRVNELCVIVSDESDVVLVQIKCDITTEELGTLLGQIQGNQEDN